MRAALLLIAIAACRTPPARPAGAPAPGDDAAAVEPTADAAVAEVAPAPLTEAECVRFVDHTIEVGMAQQRATKSEDYVPTAEQVAAIRTRLLAGRPCDGLTRPEWECALAATTQELLYRCAAVSDAR